MRWVTQAKSVLHKSLGGEVLPIHEQPRPQSGGSAGNWSSGPPVASKTAVLLFYISCSFCVLGVILIVRSFFLTSLEDRPQILLSGSLVSLVGILLALVMHVLNKREHDRFVSYVRCKAEEMKDAANSRQKFNKDYEERHWQAGIDGPNGVR